MSRQTKRSTAIHEAGHAVVGRVLGMVCGDATIVPDCEKGEAGYSIICDPWATASKYSLDTLSEEEWLRADDTGIWPIKVRDSRLAFRGRILTCMAGAEAEKELLGYYVGGDGDDRRDINIVVDSGHAEIPDWPRYEARARRQVRRLVRKHRRKIERVAAALQRRTTLTAEQIDRLMQD